MAVRHCVACIGFRPATPPSGRAALRDTLTTVMPEYADRILPVEPEAAAWTAQLRVKARRSGRVLHLADALLAGTIMAQDPVIATRNTSDFYGLDLGRVEADSAAL